MRYKKGDRVRIKSLEWYYANRNSEGVIIFPDFRIFDDSMSEFCGKVVTIDAYNPRGDYYDIKEDGKVNFWRDDMIEGLVIKDPQEKMVSLEKVVEYLEANFPDIENVGSWYKESFIKNFRKVMEK